MSTDLSVKVRESDVSTNGHGNGDSDGYSINIGPLPDYVGSGEFLKNLTENQKFSIEKKYLVRDEDGNICETPAEAMYRLAKTMSDVENKFGKTKEEVAGYAKDFYMLMAEGEFSPGGRIWTNAGTHIKGLFNCYVLPVPDDMKGIYASVGHAAIIHKNGGGTGYNFSELRPRGTYVQRSKGIASGVVSFIGQFDKETEIINSGNRRGANMGILDINHPDIMDFIYAKSVKKEITNFNVSIGAYDKFMQAVEDKTFFDLEFPLGTKFHYSNLEQIVKNIEDNKLGGSEVGQKPKPASLRVNKINGKVIPGESEVLDSYSNKVAGKVATDGTVQLYAPYVLDIVADLAWKTGDPGVIFLDKINATNPLPNVGLIRATNPCGEQPLHPYDACNLGSILLNKMLKRDNGKTEIDYERLRRVVTTATRFMDNVNDANKGPIPQVEETVLRHRRIGMGVMGWADMLAELGIAYDSKEGYDTAERVMEFITDTAKKASVELAKEKGVFPAFKGSKYDTGKLDDRVRNIDRTTIAPTGTISMLYDTSSGVEPFFAISWVKNIRGGDKLYYTLPLFEKKIKERGLKLEEILPLIENNHGSVQGIDKVPKDIQEIFKTAHDLGYESHVLMQAAFQRATDNAVSKTINMKNEATVEDIKNAYFLAWKNDLKGMTVYRDGSKDVQVLETGHGKKEQIKGSIENPLKVPAMMPSLKIRQKTPFGNMHVFLVIDPKTDYRPVEVFSTIGNSGGQEVSTLEGLGRLTSLWLRSGGSLENIIDQLNEIGSGISTSTSSGVIKSLEMGFAKALMKYEIGRKKYTVDDILLGKVDYNKFDDEVSEVMKKYSDQKNGWKKYDPAKELASANVNGNGNKIDIALPRRYGIKCPQCQSGELVMEEGCKNCHSCGFSEC